MRRPTPPGTPSRSSRYVMPSDRRRLVRWSLAGASGALVLGVGLYVAGLHRLASPGALAAAHGATDTQCTQCHEPAKSVAVLRCERCHDPIDSRRFGSPAHAALGGEGAAHVAAVNCTTCHAEHGGRRLDLTRVADARCVSCHDFASFRGHPEFALVRAARDERAGLDFSHEIHLREVAKSGGDRCQACHQPTPDQRGFEPIAFDTHCAKCHLLDRKSVV